MAAVLCLLLGVGSLGYAPAAQAQEVDAPRYTFALVGVPLGEALNLLIDRTTISLFYESGLVGGRTTHCAIREATQEAVLRCILARTGLDFYRLSSGTYVLMAQPEVAPRYSTLTGRVLDANTGEPLPDASILLPTTGTATNGAGRFAFIRLKPGPYPVTVTHIAYEDAIDTVWVDPDGYSHLDVALRPRVVLTAPVVVNGLVRRVPSATLGQARREAPALNQMPDAAADALRDLDAVVGVQVGDALSEVHVQGGASGEHQYLLYGANVFVPIRNGGFIGPFSPFALKQITVHKAGFGAIRGSHLAGIIAVEHEVAPSARPSVVVQADPLSVNARLSARVGREEGWHARWMVAGRKDLWGVLKPRPLDERFQRWSIPNPLLYEALRPEAAPIDLSVITGPVEVGFTDLHAAVRLQKSPLQSVYASYYHGQNTFGNEALSSGEDQGGFSSDEYTWTNRTAQVRYEWVQGSRMFAHVGVWNSTYRLNHPFIQSPLLSPVSGNAPTAQADLNEINENGFRVGADLALNARHTLTGILELDHTYTDFAFSFDPLGRLPAITADRIRPVRWRWQAALEDAVAVGLQTTVTGGLRLTYLHLQRRLFAEPRLSVRHDLPDGPGGAWAFHAAAGLYRQFINQFDVAAYNVTALLPSFRFWLPLSQEVRPPSAYHFTASALFMPPSGWEVGLEGYYKHQPHLVVLDYGSLITATPGLFAAARGYAYGAGLTLQRTLARSHLEAGYGYAVARRRVANRFGGRYTPVPWEAPHKVNLRIDYRPHPYWTVTLRWKGLWGRSWGFRQGYYDYLEPDPATRQFAPYDLSDPASHRLPVFSQIDVGLAYTRRAGPLRLQARLNLINALDRDNVTDWGLQLDPGQNVYRRTTRTAIPFIPLLSLRASY